MLQNQLHSNLLGQVRSAYPDANFDFLNDQIYSQPLTLVEQQAYIQLLDFTRELQQHNSAYEAIYRRLLHLYVLNGGRIDALKVIDRRLEGLKSSIGSLVFISGVSGIGKTSLASVFQQRVLQQSLTFVIARCREQEVLPYSLWQKVAHEIEAITGQSAAGLAAPIGRGPQAHSQQELIREFSDWLLRCAEECALVILLDDLQWADIDSLELLDSFTSRYANTPILFIATYSSDSSHQSHTLDAYLPKFQRNRTFDLISLTPFNHADIKRLVTAYLGPCRPELADYLFKQAEGHPLFSIELLEDLIKQTLLTKDDQGYWLPPQESVPVTLKLRQLITQRVNGLGKQPKRLLELAAVVGEIWPLQIVEQLFDSTESELIAAVEIALRSEIIVVENEEIESYRFSHGLIRDVLYQQQIVRRRKRLHEQIALHHENLFPENTHAIAFHSFEGEDWAKASRYYMLAAQEASGRLANNSALSLYQKALHAVQRDRSEVNTVSSVDIYERLGRIYHTLEQRQQAEMAYSRMRDAAINIKDRAGEGRALANLGYIRISSYQFKLAEDATRAALEIAAECDDNNLFARAYMNIIKLLSIQGKLEAFDVNWELFREHAEKLADFVSLSEGYRYLALKSVWTCQYSTTETFARKALEYAQMAAEPLPILGGHQVLSFAKIELGQYAEAYQQIESVLSLSETIDTHHHQLPRLLNQMGYLLLEIGAPQEALTWDKMALEASKNTQGANVYEMQRYSLLNIASDLLHLGQIGEALDIVAQFEAIKDGADYVRFRYYNRYLLLLSELKLKQQFYSQAIELAQEARTFAIKYNNSKNIAKSHWLEGNSLLAKGRPDAAIKHLLEAVTIADQIQHGSLCWKIRLSLAEALPYDGRDRQTTIAEARHLIDKTIDSLSQSHLQKLFLMSNWLNKLEELEQTAVPKKPIYPAGLTHREVEVLRLVASGCTNKQVADSLHISPRTVNTHMTNILNKTNCENRTAATAFAIQRNLVSK